LAKPNDTPLSITPEALETASRHCLANPEVESCGFILGRGGVGTRVVGVRNVAEYPASTFDMHHQGILDTMAEADDHKEDVVAVYHSHPNSEAIPSPRDKNVPDIDPAQLIISLKDGAPRARAWRIDVPFVGERRATEVLLHLSTDGQPFALEAVPLPWCLTEGNAVLIEYAKHGRPGTLSVLGKVVGVSDIGQGESTLNVLIQMNGSKEPKPVNVSRVQNVTVVKESPAARRLRSQMVMISRRVAHLVSGGDFTDVPELISLLTAAFPDGMAAPKLEGNS
jgi:[CysO sulfur-carrier protein]-S-L-cysteine hydrolase